MSKQSLFSSVPTRVKNRNARFLGRPEDTR
jgi:hypothetical protein